MKLNVRYYNAYLCIWDIPCITSASDASVFDLANVEPQDVTTRLLQSSDRDLQALKFQKFKDS